MKDSYVLRLPYAQKKELGFISDEFVMDEDDVEALKIMAKKEGRSLRTFVTYRLKEIAKSNLIFVKKDK